MAGQAGRPQGGARCGPRPGGPKTAPGNKKPARVRVMARLKVWRAAAWCLGWAVGAGAVNLLTNGSFEQAAGGLPAGWQVDPGAARAEMTLDEGSGRSGRAALKIVHRAPMAPHVFSQVWQTVRVRPSTRYTLSCYVRTREGGRAWLGGGKDWQYRYAFPTVTEGWQRVVGSFTTGEDERRFTVRILSESPTPGTWVDDVQLEEGDAATEFVYLPPLAPGESRLAAVPLVVGPNLVPNPSFEDLDRGVPRGWRWDARNTDATFAIETASPCMGTAAVRIANGTPFGPHVYGWFGLTEEIPVEPDTVYTLSAFVRCEDDTVAWSGGGPGWTLRVLIPNTQGQWQAVSHVFRTGSEQTGFALMVVTESPTRGIWLDGFCLRKGAGALPPDLDPDDPRDALRIGPEPPEVLEYRGASVETRWAPELYPPGEWVFATEEFRGAGVLTLETAGGAAVEAALTDAEGRELARAAAACPEAARVLALDYAARVEPPADGRLVLTARARRADRVLAEARQEVRLVTAGRVEARLREVEAARERLRALVERLEARGAGDYARVTLTVLENFVPWAREDAAAGRVDRAWHAAETMVGMAARAFAEGGAVENGDAPALPVPRYVTSPVAIEGPSFIGVRRAPGGLEGRGPVFFTGYGHFAQVRQDIEKFPAYGCNLVQIEFGPNSVLPAEDRVDLGPVREFLAVCDRAAAAHVGVNLLLSPHYFPRWALEKWPELTECRGGFFGYCVHAPESRQVLEKFLRTVIPLIKDHPALHSLCLSNEPISTEVQGCRHLRAAWGRWLAARHGTSAELNRRWGTTYATFDEVPIPEAFPASAAAVDFCRFNQEQFAGFHRWMADVIHEMAPAVPVHAKIMMDAHFARHRHGIWSVCPELFGELSQIHGNDCSSMVSRRGEWSRGWRHCEMAYDFQRSLGDKPVFNSENHVIRDRDHGTIPPGHLYTTLWQGALHGQSATTLWVWQRAFDHTSDLEGSVIHRPDAAEAVGRCALDLMRLADEMTALQREPPQVVLYWSQSSVILGEAHLQAVSQCYENAAFLGVPLGFVTDRQLERYGAGGTVPAALAGGAARVLLVPEAGHVSDAALAGLARAASGGVRVVRAGPCFGADEYGAARQSVPAIGEELPGYGSRGRDGFARFCAAAAGWSLSPVLAATAPDGRPVYGVETRSARLPGGRLVASLCNHTREPAAVVLRREGAPVASVHRQSGRPLEPSFVVPVLEPMLVEVR